MMIEIKNRFTGNTIISGQYASVRESCENRANLRGADLIGADLRRADLIGADLRGANLIEADLIGADLREADLIGADLREADLRGANLIEADLNGADLRGANLRGANLNGADLRGADLRGGNLIEADLNGADLRGANLWEANLDIPIIQISGSKHSLLSIEESMQIGCHTFSVEYWKMAYDTIGRSEGYSESEIREYYEYIKMCDDIQQRSRLRKQVAMK